MNIDDHLGTVNSLVALFRRSETNPVAVQWLPKLGLLSEFLITQKRLMAPIPKSLGDISDLPEELVRELSVQKTDELEDQILTVMRACQGEANLDQVLVGLYRKFHVVQTRRFIQNKLYRMSKKELVFQIPGQRAAYSLDPQSGPGEPPGSENGHAPRLPSNSDLDDEIPF